MDNQKRFNEEVSNKVARLNILIEDLGLIIENISVLASDEKGG